MSTKNIQIRNVFSERLRELRANKGLKSLEMADLLGFSQPVYSRYENGRTPDVDTVSAISDACGVTIDWLLGRSNELRAGVHEVGKGSANELRAGVHEVGKGSAGEPLLNLVQGCTRLEKGQEQSIHGAAELSALEAFFWSESLLPPAATS